MTRNTQNATIRKPTAARVCTPTPWDAPDLEGVIEVGPAIAHSGVGTVYRGYQRSLDRPVALKYPNQDSMVQAEAVLHEARIASRLSHRVGACIHGLFKSHDGSPVLSVELLTGPSWTSRIYGMKRPAPRACLLPHVETGIEVATTALLAHQERVLHLDIKPANVLQDSTGNVHLVDWSVALDLASEEPHRVEFQGTPSYAAPEMVQGGPLGPHTDIYLLGGCLYEVLYGLPPHERPTVEASLNAAFQPVELPMFGDDELRSIVQRALQVDPADRWPDMLALRTALEGWISHHGSILLVQEAKAALGLQGQLPDREVIYELEAARSTIDTALELWEHNPQAHALAEQLDVESFQLHLTLGNLDTAARLVTRLPHPELHQSELDEARRVRDTRSEASTRIQQRRQREDPDTGAHTRKWVLLAAWTPLLLAVLVSFRTWREATPSPVSHQLVYALLGFVFWLLSLQYLRTKLPDTLTNRDLPRVLTGAFCGVIANRLAGWLTDMESTPVILGDLVVMGAAFGIFGGRRRGMTLLAIGCLLGAFTIAIYPLSARTAIVVVLLALPAVVIPSFTQGRRR